MPTKPKRPCSYVGCPELTAGQYCDNHQKQVARAYDRRRGSAASRGYDRRWWKARKRFLLGHPLCVECERKGKVTAASVVDHITPHKGDQARFGMKATGRASANLVMTVRLPARTVDGDNSVSNLWIHLWIS